jgi:hypothetical protein
MMKVFYDKRVSVYDKVKEINVFSFSKVKKLLDRMDQETYTEIVIENKNTSLTIGGGNGNYIVFYTIDEYFYNLINNNCINETEELPLVAGGQEGIFPKRQIVNYDLMIEACENYYRKNEMDQNLTWEKNNN